MKIIIRCFAYSKNSFIVTIQFSNAGAVSAGRRPAVTVDDWAADERDPQ